MIFILYAQPKCVNYFALKNPDHAFYLQMENSLGNEFLSEAFL